MVVTEVPPYPKILYYCYHPIYIMILSLFATTLFLFVLSADGQVIATHGIIS